MVILSVVLVCWIMLVTDDHFPWVSIIYAILWHRDLGSKENKNNKQNGCAKVPGETVPSAFLHPWGEIWEFFDINNHFCTYLPRMYFFAPVEKLIISCEFGYTTLSVQMVPCYVNCFSPSLLLIWSAHFQWENDSF